MQSSSGWWASLHDWSSQSDAGVVLGMVLHETCGALGQGLSLFANPGIPILADALGLLHRLPALAAIEPSSSRSRSRICKAKPDDACAMRCGNAWATTLGCPLWWWYSRRLYRHPNSTLSFQISSHSKVITDYTTSMQGNKDKIYDTRENKSRWIEIAGPEVHCINNRFRSGPRVL